MGKPGKIIMNWDEDDILVNLSFGIMAEKYQNIKLQIDELEPQKKSLGEELEMLLKASGHQQVSFNGMVCSRRNGGQPSRIDATKLLEAGVDADVIAAATVPGGKYTYFEMRDPTKQKDNRKHKGGDDDGE